jgi:transposase
VELLVERAAALDVGKDEVVACIRVPDAAGAGRGRQRRRQEVRTYPTFTSSLEALADWLQAEGVTQVVMEATGQYWKPCVRHEVPRIRAEVKGLRLRPVAAGR